jgi:hypothetical protein
MNRNIAKIFEKHVVVFSNTHRVPFSNLTSVIVQHSTLQAVIMLGHPADMHYGLMQLASPGRNEVMPTFGRRAWDVLEMAGGSQSTNVIYVLDILRTNVDLSKVYWRWSADRRARTSYK